MTAPAELTPEEEAEAAAAALAAEEEEAAAKAADALGDKGKQALDRMKAKWQAERDKRSAIEAENAALKAANAPKGDDAELAAARQKAVDDAIKAATSKANDRIVRSEIRAAATGKLANPALALKLLDLTQFEVDDDGNVDADEINDAIAELIEKEPYLAAQGRRFQGDPDAGPRGKTPAGKPVQVTEDQLSTMSANEIVKAQKEGRLDDLLGITAH
jgi:hypothetical protein